VNSVRNTYAIAEREVGSYLRTPMGYILAAVFLFGTGLLFALILLQSNEASLRFFHSNLNVIWLFVMPLVTMRLLAEEQRSGTIELLRTSPVRDFEIVLGKFFGGLGLMLFMLLFTLYYPALIYLLQGRPDVGPMAAGYLGAILQGAAFLAFGLFASSLTENQIIAAMLSFIVFLFLWLADGLASNLGPNVREIYRYLSVNQHVQDFGRGVIDTTHIVFFLSVVVACLALAILSMQSRRWRG
jgi:ABC-2 type transport system permease protein